MFTALFWRDTAERVLATAAQVAISLLLVDSATVGLLDVDWPGGLAVVGSAALVSLLKALVATRIGDRDSASLSPGVGTIEVHRS